MKLGQQDSSEELTESTLPMINVVFLLLIFFMIAGSLQKSLPFDLTPLKAEGNIAQQDAPLFIHVSSDGRIMIDEEIVPLESLKNSIRQHKSSDKPVPEITIRSDQTTNTATIIKILSQLKDLGAEQVALAAVR